MRLCPVHTLLGHLDGVLVAELSEGGEAKASALDGLEVLLGDDHILQRRRQGGWLAERRAGGAGGAGGTVARPKACTHAARKL